MIVANELTKKYGSLTAVDQLSFAVEPGQVLGFLGPNGAGKSTTMKIITGFLAPSSGSVSVCGFALETQPIKAKACIGYLPEGAPSYGEMTPLQFLDFIADMRGLRSDYKRARLHDVISRLHQRDKSGAERRYVRGARLSLCERTGVGYSSDAHADTWQL